MCRLNLMQIPLSRSHLCCQRIQKEKEKRKTPQIVIWPQHIMFTKKRVLMLTTAIVISINREHAQLGR